jgi:shikimate kinase
MMGAGKSTVGGALASLTGWRYVDNDDLVLAATGLDVVHLLAARGRDALHAAESDALTTALKLPRPVVAGVAGGVVLVEADRRRLRDDGFTVYLRASVDTLTRRILSGPARPWVVRMGEDGVRAEIEELQAARAPHFVEVAALTVDVDTTPPDELASTIYEAFISRYG